MEVASFDTREVQITSLAFLSRAGRPLESYPQRMVYEGREYDFTDLGMRYLVKKGQQLFRLFDVSDGRTQYRLRLDPENRWTLVNMRAVA